MKMRAGMTLVILASGLVACGPVSSNNNNNSQTNNNNTTGPCSNGSTRCYITQWQTCVDRTWVTSQNCSGATPYCAEGIGCAVCQPNLNYCESGTQPRQCTANGQPGTLLEACGEGETCQSGSCTSACIVAESTMSYIGCEYWPTPTANSQLADAFADDFGVVVHNANDQAATVTIDKGGSQVATASIPAGELHTFQLPIDTGLKLTYGEETSVKVASAAYHLVSTLPVTVYQFNPLNYALEVDSSLCPVDAYYGTYPPCHSYSNDAALLLPQHVLSQNYIVMARQTFGVGGSFIPGFVAIVGTENNTTVNITSTANTAAGTGVAAMTPTGSQTLTINRGEVVQIISAIPTSCSGGTTVGNYCDMGAAYDLTGSVIDTSAPVAVYSGHNCSFVPFNYYACDHLEEQMIPLESWGKEFIVGRTDPQSPDTAEPNVVRILSGADANEVRVTPNPAESVFPGGSVVLDKGRWVEFEAMYDFHVDADGPIMIGQFLVGQNYYTDDYNYWGDPSFSLAVPIEQYRTNYTFLVPSSITYNYVNVIKNINEGSPSVLLDGVAIPDVDFANIPGTEFGVARVEISEAPYSHTIESELPFGIVVYGFASYTSYMYPGGLDLEYINPVD